MEENKKEIVGLLNLIHDEKYIDFIRCLLKDYVKSSSTDQVKASANITT